MILLFIFLMKRYVGSYDNFFLLNCFELYKRTINGVPRLAIVFIYLFRNELSYPGVGSVDFLITMLENVTIAV